MDKTKDRKLPHEGKVPEPSPSDLLGRQSVRATFRLSRGAIEAISLVSANLGIKQKSIIDHLLEDMEALSLIAERIQSSGGESSKRVQKTYVVSRRTLTCLERIAREFETPRDALLEYSVKRLLPILSEERRQHRKRKQVLRDVDRYLREGKKVLEKSLRLLGKDDPVYRMLESGLKGVAVANDQIASFIDRGKGIEEY